VRARARCADLGPGEREAGACESRCAGLSRAGLQDCPVVRVEAVTEHEAVNGVEGR